MNAPAAARREFRWLLKDDTRVTLREIGPEDRERLRAGVHLFSPATLYRRFFAPVTELSEAQLTFLTEVDQVDHIAWGVQDDDHPEIPGLGVGRCVRLPEDRSIAEAAIIVLDSYHGRGLGTLLLAVLNVRAHAEGVRLLRSMVLVENTGFTAHLKHLGAKARHEADGVLCVDLPVYLRGRDAPHTPAGRRYGELIDAVAAKLGGRRWRLWRW
jgi:GNAT superfamily N-acetyltransferase